MIRIDSDTHFTPLDAFADLEAKYAEQGPRVVALARWAVSHRLSGTRALCTGAYQTAARERPAQVRF